MFLLFRRIFKPLWKRPKIRRRNNYEDNIFKIPFENKDKEKISQLDDDYKKDIEELKKMYGIIK